MLELEFEPWIALPDEILADAGFVESEERGSRAFKVRRCFFPGLGKSFDLSEEQSSRLSCHLGLSDKFKYPHFDFAYLKDMLANIMHEVLMKHKDEISPEQAPVFESYIQRVVKPESGLD